MGKSHFFAQQSQLWESARCNAAATHHHPGKRHALPFTWMSSRAQESTVK
jgi:hypothetical protein